jgi:putative alpha-1,2-mannosidase
LFPVAGQNLFLVNAPAFAHATIDVGGRDFIVETEGFVEPHQGGPPQYVQRAHLDDRPLDVTHLSGHDLRRARRLRRTLGPRPSDWGRLRRPPSTSTSVPTT